MEKLRETPRAVRVYPQREMGCKKSLQTNQVASQLDVAEADIKRVISADAGEIGGEYTE
jgi:hypothetical protein